MSEFAPETGPDGRPRPRYGEYATPEEQRARIRQPDATFALDAGVAPDDTVSRPAPPPQAARGVPAGPPVAAPSAVRPASRPADRVATLALLAYGAFNVIVSAISYFDLPALANQAMKLLGIEGEFTNVDAARLWGPIAAVVLVIGYLITLAFSLARLRAGRLAWWVPIVGAVATMIAVSICLTIPIFGDPAFSAFRSSLS